jgi:hypothetical protein
MDIRMLTHCIVQKDREYLKGRCLVTGMVQWNNSPYEAWKTRDLGLACKVANKTGGTVILFNPAIGKTAKLRCMS